jgi:hypothetical protein
MDPTDSDLDAARRRTVCALCLIIQSNRHLTHSFCFQDEDNSIKKDLDVESFGARKVKVTTLG